MSKPREVQLASRPVGWPTPENFALVEGELPDLGRGPGPRAQRRHVGRPLHARPDERRQVLRGAVRAGRRPWTAARSARSSSPAPTGFAVGDLVLHGLGWREHAVLDATPARVGRPGGGPGLRLPRRARHDRA